MPYKLTPAEIKEKWAAYRQNCDNNMVKRRRGSKVLDVRRPVMYDMAEFCRFAGIDPRTVAGMADNINYKTVIHDIRCTVLRRKLQGLAHKEGRWGALLPELAGVYGLHAEHVRRGRRMRWLVRFNPVTIEQGSRRCAPAAAITLAVIERAGFEFYL